MPNELVLIAIAAVGAGFITILLARRRERRRIAVVMGGLGLQFAGRDPSDLLAKHHDLVCFRRGHNHRVWDLMRGTFDQGEVIALRHSYETGFASHRKHHVEMVVIVQIDRPLIGVVALADGELAPVGPFESYRRIGLSGAEESGPSWRMYTDRPAHVGSQRSVVRAWIAQYSQPAYLLETRGHRVAAACRDKGQPAQFAQLVESVRELARGLAAEASPR